ncbi:hypothetical protein MJO52_11885 [Microbulbifer variabilis]|uniref:Putative adhesin Stv domain-containing protein n=1 Tax=Microbulbifer variabilis TaxID=266805 RepID=A0ABY4V681_9GAMM|nr:hypothetical protein [Microbulbifer variabilis]USD19783.1 hypothetical protein MJO52_11885 [Microbulbifer variabilis]
MSKKYSGLEWTAWFHGGFQPGLIALEDDQSKMVTVPGNVLLLTYTAIGTSLAAQRAVSLYNEITRVGRPSLRKFVFDEHQKTVNFKTFSGKTEPNQLVQFEISPKQAFPTETEGGGTVYNYSLSAIDATYGAKMGVRMKDGGNRLHGLNHDGCYLADVLNILGRLNGPQVLHFLCCREHGIEEGGDNPCRTERLRTA